MLVFGVLFFSGCLPVSTKYYNATSSKFRGKFSSFLKEGEREKYSWYHYMTSVNKKGEYIIRIFYPEKKVMTSYTTFTSEAKLKRNGYAAKYNDDGEILEEGAYRNDKKEGDWNYYGGKDNKLKTGNYKNGMKSGLWKTFDEQEQLRFQVPYVNGKKEGEFIQYDSLQHVINQGIYKADTIFKQSNPPPKRDTLGKESMPLFYNCSWQPTAEGKKICSDQKLLEYIYRKIKYPKIAREYGVGGTALVNFVIEKDGSISNVKTLRGICQSIEYECVNLIKSMPEWYQAGYQDGKPVRVSFNLPIKFKLED